MAYNLFATDKQRNYPSAATQQQPQIAGAAQGATPQEFAQGKQNANSQSGAAPATATTPQQPTVRQQAATPQPAAASAVTRTAYQKPIDPTSTTAGLDALNALYTSPQEEERLRQASLQRQRIMAVGDALRHIGNIYNTVNYAPPQIFNSPVETEHKRYLSEKQLRDQNNLKFMTYQQAKAAQDAKQKQWEADYGLKVADAARKAGFTEAQIKNMNDRLAQQKAYQDANIELGRQKAKDAKDLGERRLAQQTRHQNTMAGIAARNARTNERRAAAYEKRLSASGGGGASGVAPLDTPKGRITPNGRNYSNQIEQIWSYAKEKNLVKESDVERQLRSLGLGKDKSSDVRHQMVLDLLRTNQSVGDYAAERLGWSYSGGAPASNWDEYAEEEDDWSQYEE